MKKEIWKDVVGYENIYEVSNLGRIRSAKGKTTQSTRHGTRKWKQRILKQKISKDGTCRADLWKNKMPKTFLVHQLVANAFIKQVEGKEYINHIDGNRLNNHVENLEWCTHEENNRHAFKNGLMPTNQFVVLEDLTNGKLHKFTSMSKASQFLGRNHNFISSTVDNGDYIIDYYAVYLTAMPNLERIRFINERLKEADKT